MRKFWGIFLGVTLGFWGMVPLAWGWEHPLVHRFQEAQSKEKEIFSVLPELKGYLLKAPSRNSAQNSLKNLSAAPQDLGTSAPVNFYQALLSFWAEDQREAEKFLELAKNNAREDVGGLWLMTQRAYRAGWSEAAFKLVDQLKEAAKDVGIKDLRPYSQTLVFFARERAQAGDYPGAMEWLKKAELLSPQWPGSYFTRARINLQRGYVHIPEALGAVIVGYTAGLRSPWTLMTWKAHLFYGLQWLLVFLLLIGAFALLLKNTPLILHDIQEFITRGRPFQVINTLTIICLFLPLLLGFGLLWQGIFWLLLFFPYANLKEKIWSVLFLLLLLSTPLFLSSAGSISALFASPRSQLLMLAQESGYDTALIENLKTFGRQEPKNPLIPYLSGLLFYRGGDFTQAEREFKTALEIKPRWYPALVNLGNTYFGMNALEQAAQEYRRALEQQPKIVAAHYNLSQIYTAQLKLTEARTEYDQAVKIDAELVASYEQSTSPNPNRRIMEQRLSDDEFFTWASPPPVEVKRFIQNLWSGRLGDISLSTTPATLILVLILTLVLTYIRKRRGLAQCCQKCGQPYCKRCHPQQRGENLCLACNAIFIRKDAVIVQRKVERQLAVQTYQQQRRIYSRSLNLLLPGMGHYYWGDSLKGLIFSALAAILVVFFFLPAPAFLPLTEREPYLWRIFLGGAVFVLLYVIVQLDLRRRARVR